MNEDMNIFFTIDNRFAKHCAATIASILKNSTYDKDNLIINIISADLSEENKNKISSLSTIRTFQIHFFDIDDTIFKNYQMPAYISSNAALYRYLIPTILPSCDKALYLDSDIIVKGSLSPLFNTNLDNNYIAGVEDFHWNMAWKRIKLNSSIKEPYFNSGVLLINCKKWREDNIFEKLIEQTNNLNPKMLEQLDQDAINIVCENRKVLLHPKYNLLSCFTDCSYFTQYSKEEMQDAINSPVIIHYTGGIKPWIKKGFPLNQLSYEYHRYLQMTAYYDKSFETYVSIFNIDTKKSLKKLEKNGFLIFLWGIICLPLDIINLILSLAKFWWYKNKFKLTEL